MTVLWSRPPKWYPMLLSDKSVNSFARNMATCRGNTVSFFRLLPFSSESSTLKWPVTVSRIVSMVTTRSVSLTRCRSVARARSMSMSRRVSEACAISDTMTPSSSRTLVSMECARYSSTS